MTEGAGVVGDGTWLSTGEVVQLYRDAGYPEHEATIRRELDDAIDKGEVDSYRTRGGRRRLRAADVRALVAVKNMPVGEQRDAELVRLRTANRK